MPEDYQEAAVKTFFQVHSDQPAGDVLIFLTGSFCLLLSLIPSSRLANLLVSLSFCPPQVKKTSTTFINRSRLSLLNFHRVSSL